MHGRDFDDAKAHAATLVASDAQAEFVPSYHRDLVAGVATYARELFAAGTFDVVYVPIGLGSGISGVIAVRDLLGLDTEVVGVVSDRFPAYARSVERGTGVETEPAESVADGMAVRTTDPAALAVIERALRGSSWSRTKRSATRCAGSSPTRKRRRRRGRSGGRCSRGRTRATARQAGCGGAVRGKRGREEYSLRF